jgi:hypothetical protein
MGKMPQLVTPSPHKGVIPARRQVPRIPPVKEAVKPKEAQERIIAVQLKRSPGEDNAVQPTRMYI